MDLKAATKMFEELRDEVFPHYKIGLLHGKMKAGEKEEVMQQICRAARFKYLVSTTVIEVGVDVPNASFDDYRTRRTLRSFAASPTCAGASGAARNNRYCVLLTGDKKTAVARERLGIMEETTDGFRIAEKDLEIRGQGEILGTRQSGVQTFQDRQYHPRSGNSGKSAQGSRILSDHQTFDARNLRAYRNRQSRRAFSTGGNRIKNRKLRINS